MPVSPWPREATVELTLPATSSLARMGADVPTPTLPPLSCRTTFPLPADERMYQSPVGPNWMWLQLGPRATLRKAAVFQVVSAVGSSMVSRALGLVVPMPTLPVSVIRRDSLTSLDA